MNKPIKVLKNDEEDVPLEIFEQAIVDIANAAKRLLGSRLNERAVVILVHEAMPAGPNRPSRRDVLDVLNAAAGLEKKFLKEKTK